MYRKIEEDLKNWKENYKMPLMLVGARQTGKTYLLDNFCKNNYNNYLYINLDKDENAKKVFENSINPETIIEQLEILKNRTLNAEDTILFLDEIQVSERAITSLKYFCESDKPYKIVCAGSLLGVKINRFKSSFPVGKVNIKYLYPMNFEEFLIAIKEEKLLNEIKKHFANNEKLIEPIHDKALDLYKKYLVLGGMPALINNFIENNYNISHVNFELQEQIITAYLADMTKYTENSEGIKNNQIYNAIPKELARENNTFKFSIVDESARKIRYESSLDWLLASNMVLKCSLTEKNESPLKAFISSEKFKLYLSDPGLLRALSNLDYQEILLEKNEMFKGVLTENYVACELYPNAKELFYYNFDKYEIDFLIKINGEIIPVEVKSGRRTNSKSLNEYIKKYKPQYSIRISSKNFEFENNIKSVPLYAVFCINNH
ncbi:MAG: ATP-binding protein [Bacilli bacterium]|nr:ATP-binding protein [Bacilli bacterium]